jgi:hypothetical protein
MQNNTLVTVEKRKFLKPICGKIVRTTDNNRRPCLRPERHPDGCNPFSDTLSPMEKAKSNK